MSNVIAPLGEVIQTPGYMSKVWEEMSVKSVLTPFFSHDPKKLGEVTVAENQKATV